MHRATIPSCSKTLSLGSAAFGPTMYAWRVSKAAKLRPSASLAHFLALIKRMPRINRAVSTYAARKNVKAYHGTTLNRVTNRRLGTPSFRKVR